MYIAIHCIGQTISSHRVLNSGLSVGPFLVWCDAWLCRSAPPWWVQCLFPAEHRSLQSLALLFSPLLHPFLGVSKTPFGMVNTPRWIHPPWSRRCIWLRSRYPYWLLQYYCPRGATVQWPLFSLFTTFCTGTYNTSIFSWIGVQATVPSMCSWFLSIFITSSAGCF